MSRIFCLELFAQPQLPEYAKLPRVFCRASHTYETGSACQRCKKKQS